MATRVAAPPFVSETPMKTLTLAHRPPSPFSLRSHAPRGGAACSMVAFAALVAGPLSAAPSRHANVGVGVRAELVEPNAPVDAALGAATRASEFDAAAFTGTWHGSVVTPLDPKPLELRFGLQVAPDGHWIGGFVGDEFGTGLLDGNERGDGLDLVCDTGSRRTRVHLDPEGAGALRATMLYQSLPLSIRFERTSETWADELRHEVALPEERPTRTWISELPDPIVDAIEAELAELLAGRPTAGVALGIALDGELAFARGWGFADVASGRALEAGTFFRWASISKSVTGLVAGMLALEERLDLDLDVRELVPEFPAKAHVVTTRQLLGHLGGIVHYQHLPPVVREAYDDPFPFRDRIRALDMFKQAPLIAEPGTKYSYSTHGFVLAGAAIERASEHGYLGEVNRRVRDPLRMTSFEPDDPSARRPERTTGYRVTTDGRLFDAGDTDVSWKVPGGGFQSTVLDLARYGAGLCDEGFVGAELRQLVWTRGRTKDGTPTSYGLGFSLGDLDGHRSVSHGGAQRRTATQLFCLPDDGVAIALMCNTEGTPLGGPARRIARLLLPVAAGER